MSEGSRLSLRDRISWQTRHGRRLVVGQQELAYDVAVTPESRALLVRWSRGGFVWNRPTAVLVERAGQVERIPIVDSTRRAQLILAGLGLLFWLAAAARGKRKNHE